ncbi:MAG: hypothetical protein K0R63_808 [Rickettsiales bacterium]|jgi:hypothetical protein|nr:hypothetical protein [Rickettsiales bacterium]
MKSLLIKLSIVVVLAFTMAACRTSDLYTGQKVSFDKPAASNEAVAKGIKRAAAGLGWRTTEKGPNKIQATINIRGKHTAVVDVNYTTSAFSIDYNRSENLKYDPTSNKIHSNYNGWVKNLENAILVEVSNR